MTQYPQPAIRSPRKEASDVAKGLGGLRNKPFLARWANNSATWVPAAGLRWRNENRVRPIRFFANPKDYLAASLRAFSTCFCTSGSLKASSASFMVSSKLFWRPLYILTE